MLVIIIDKLINVKNKLNSVGKFKEILYKLIAVNAFTFGRLSNIFLINGKYIKNLINNNTYLCIVHSNDNCTGTLVIGYLFLSETCTKAYNRNNLTSNVNNTFYIIDMKMT